MVTGFYAALAGSASVFIGILTALLVSNLSNLKSERNLIERRISTIDSRKQELEQEKEDLEEYTTGIEKPRFTEKASFSPKYQGTDDPGSMAAADKMAEVQSTRQHNERHRRWTQIRAQIDSLNFEREKLVNRYESIDPNTIVDTLYASIATIILSVGFPLFAYLLNVSNTILFPVRTWLEPLLIFVIWAGGLGYVFYHLKQQIDREKTALSIRDSREAKSHGS